MMAVLKRRLPQRAAALTGAAVVAVALACASQVPARYGAADGGVLHSNGVIAAGGFIHADGIQGTGAPRLHADGIEGSGLSPRMTPAR